MAITTYAELQQAVADNLARSDLTSFLPDFVTMAENWLNYGSDNSEALRCREMEEIVSITPASGVCALPTDYIEYRRVVEEAGQRRPLTFITPDMADVLYPARSSGLSNHFTIIGASLYSFPLASNDIELTYYQALPALSDSNTSNWLLAKSPSTYLRAALVQAAEFLKNDREAAKQAQMAMSLVAGLNKSDQMGKYARAGVTPRGITP